MDALYLHYYTCTNHAISVNSSIRRHLPSPPPPPETRRGRNGRRGGRKREGKEGEEGREGKEEVGVGKHGRVREKGSE